MRCKINITLLKPLLCVPRDTNLILSIPKSDKGFAWYWVDNTCLLNTEISISPLWVPLQATETNVSIYLPVKDLIGISGECLIDTKIKNIFSKDGIPIKHIANMLKVDTAFEDKRRINERIQ